MRLRSLAPLSLLAVIGTVVALAACGGATPEPAAPTPPPVDSSAAAPPPSAVPAPTAEPAPSAAPAASAAPAPSAAPAASAAPVIPAPPKPWKDLSHEERLAVMKTAVMPVMKPAFHDFAPSDDAFSDLTCVGCHGEGIKKGKFDMPNPALPKLDVKHDMKADVAKHPAAVKFMHEVVVPQMATMLGVAPYDPATHKGFGCMSCHTAAK